MLKLARRARGHFVTLIEIRVHLIRVKPGHISAWLVVGGRKYDPVTSVLRQLHWLPIEKRIVYRINCSQPIMLCNGLAPLYACMCDRLELRIPTRRLRSSDNCFKCSSVQSQELWW